MIHRLLPWSGWAIFAAIAYPILWLGDYFFGAPDGPAAAVGIVMLAGVAVLVGGALLGFIGQDRKG